MRLIVQTAKKKINNRPALADFSWNRRVQGPPVYSAPPCGYGYRVCCVQFFQRSSTECLSNCEIVTSSSSNAACPGADVAIRPCISLHQACRPLTIQRHLFIQRYRKLFQLRTRHCPLRTCCACPGDSLVYSPIVGQ